MTIIETMTKDLLQARKDKKASDASILRTVLGDITPKGNELPMQDGEVQKVISKVIKNLKETIQAKEKLGRETFEDSYEITVLQKYLPKELSEGELESIIKTFLEENSLTKISDMGKVMTYLRGNFSNQYEGAVASKLVKKHLN